MKLSECNRRTAVLSLDLWKKCQFVFESFPGRKVKSRWGESWVNWLVLKSDGLTGNTRMDRHLWLTDSSFLIPCPLSELKSLLLLNDQLRWHLLESQNLLASFSDGQSSMMCPPWIFTFSGSLPLSVSCLKLSWTPQAYFPSLFVLVVQIQILQSKGW